MKIEFEDGDVVYSADSTEENMVVEYKRMDGIWWQPTTLTDKILANVIDKDRL